MTMTKFSIRAVIVSVVLTIALSFVLMSVQVRSATAMQTLPFCNGNNAPCISADCNEEDLDACPVTLPPPSAATVAPPPVTGADSSGASIGGLVDQRYNQMITNR